MINPNAIAADIINNCDAYQMGSISRDRWDYEQQRLWKLAARNNMVSVVLAFVLQGEKK